MTPSWKKAGPNGKKYQKEEAPATSIGNASVSLPPDAMFKPKIAVDRRRRKDKTPVLLKRFRRHMEDNG